MLGNLIGRGVGGDVGVAGAIDVTISIGLCARALIAAMVFTFARISAALAMKVEDV